MEIGVLSESQLLEVLGGHLDVFGRVDLAAGVAFVVKEGGVGGVDGAVAGLPGP